MIVTKTFHHVPILVFLAFVLLGCTTPADSQTGTSSNDNTPLITSDSAQKAAGLTCHTAYRSTTSHAIEAEDLIELADVNTTENRVYGALEFHVDYRSGKEQLDGGRSLRVWVTEPGNEAQVITSHLYQLYPDQGPINQFGGGHGFTGLNYVYYPDSDGAELQFWCTAS